MCSFIVVILLQEWCTEALEESSEESWVVQREPKMWYDTLRVYLDFYAVIVEKAGRQRKRREEDRSKLEFHSFLHTTLHFLLLRFTRVHSSNWKNFIGFHRNISSACSQCFKIWIFKSSEMEYQTRETLSPASSQEASTLLQQRDLRMSNLSQSQEISQSQSQADDSPPSLNPTGQGSIEDLASVAADSSPL